MDQDKLTYVGLIYLTDLFKYVHKICLQMLVQESSFVSFISMYVAWRKLEIELRNKDEYLELLVDANCKMLFILNLNLFYTFM